MANSRIVCLQMKFALLSIFCLAVLTTPAQAYTVMEAGGYQVQVFTDPDPVVAKKESVLTLKVLQTKDMTPVVDAQMIVSIREINDTSNVGIRETVLVSGPEKAGKTDVFGNYESKSIFSKSGIYQIKVTLLPAGVNGLTDGTSMGFALNVSPPDNYGYRLTFILVLLLGITAAGIFLVKLKTRTPAAAGIDLLDIPTVKGIFRARYFQSVVQFLLLLFLIILIFLAFFDIQDSAKNLSVIIIWTIWWAGIIFSFVLVGRLWCFACPVGAISEWMSRVFKSQRIYPENLQNMWLANTVFVLLTWLDIQIGVVRNPLVTGLLLTGVLVVAAAIGLLYQRRTFCRYLCPIGGLIGIYSLFSPVELRSKDPEVCRCHKRKDCYLGNKNGRGCPMFELVPEIDNNKACNFCGECIKSCPKDNISIRVRPFFKDAWGTKNRSLDDVVFTMVLVGVTIFVTGDMLEPWSAWMESAMEWFPAGLFGIQYRYTIEVLTKSLLYFFIALFFIPGLILLFASGSNHLAGKENHSGLKQTIVTFGFMFIPVGLSMHLAHNIGHLLNESRTVLPALQGAINKYLPFNIGEPNWQLASVSMVGPGVVYWIQMALFLSFFTFSLLSGYRLAIENYSTPQVAFRALLPMVCIAAVLMGVNIYLLNLPMAPRHIH
jgi:hypothetical protein